MNIYEKLAQVQQELKAPKSQFNKFGNYYYRNCEDILEAAKPILAKNKVVLTVCDEIVMIGNRIYIKATARFIDAEKSSEAIENVAYAREDENKKGMDGSQITGASSSYARKYALNGLFLIDDSKDADTNEMQNQQNNAPQQQGKQAPQQTLDPTLVEQANSLKITLTKVAAYYKKDVNYLTNEELQACINQQMQYLKGKEKNNG